MAETLGHSPGREFPNELRCSQGYERTPIPLTMPDEIADRLKWKFRSGVVFGGPEVVMEADLCQTSEIRQRNSCREWDILTTARCSNTAVSCRAEGADR